jgi:magnesium chelatase subunit D
VTPLFPFSAIVGQDELRLALVLNAVAPAIGGVLVRGEKGTAKSTAVRALARLLPEIRVVAGCPFNCDPGLVDGHCPAGPHEAAELEDRPAALVELPVGASADRVAGSLDLERALTEGVRAFEPGLLAAAHRGVLYADEVNLLPDHVVDLLLDASALGTNYVERDGVSVRHAARFVLVGSMNPEEGELRPQLLDRFGLAVEAAASSDPVERAEIVRRRLAYEADPNGFAARYDCADRELAHRIRFARERLGEVRLPEAMLARLAGACATASVDGMRADLVTAKTAVALAAWEGRLEAELDDVHRALALALPHRRRREPFEQPGLSREELDQLLAPEPPEGGGDGPGDGGARPPAETNGAAAGPAPRVGAEEQVHEPTSAFRPLRLEVAGGGRGARGRRSPATSEHGRPVGARPPAGRLRDPAPLATLHAAAPHQLGRGRGGGGLVLRRADLREHVREGREGNLVVFCVDASGSMGARQRMAAVKGAVLSLLRDAYQRRDRLALIAFRGAGAELVLPPTSSAAAAAERLRLLATGGRTPLAAGLARAGELIAAERLRDPLRRPLLVVVSDGRANAGGDPLAAAHPLAASGVAALVVDSEEGPLRLGLAGELARALAAPCIRLEELAAASRTLRLGERERAA